MQEFVDLLFSNEQLLKLVTAAISKECSVLDLELSKKYLFSLEQLAIDLHFLWHLHRRGSDQKVKKTKPQVTKYGTPSKLVQYSVAH